MINRNWWARTSVLRAMVVGTLLFAFPLLAQQQTPAPADTSPPGQSKAGAQSGENKDPAIQEQKSIKQEQQSPGPADTTSQGQSKAGAQSGENKDPAIQEQKSIKQEQQSPAPADTSSPGQSKAGGQSGENKDPAIQGQKSIKQEQQSPAPADTSSPGQSKAGAQSGENKDPAIQEQKSPKQEQQSPTNDRLFFLLPNYLTVENAKQIPPLTTGQKFKLVALGTFDPVEFPYVGTLALIDQAEDDDPSFGQGLKGYAKRYGAAFADTTIENFMVGAVFPTLLHQDPRYYQLGKGGFWHRAGYAALRIFITRSDSGNTQFNYSELAGSAIAAALSNTYHPPHDRTALNSANIWVTQLWGDAVGFEVKEFWPDIRRKFHRK